MAKEEKLKRIQRIREQARHATQKYVLQYKPVSEKIRKRLKRGWSKIKRIAKKTVLIGTVITAGMTGSLSERSAATPTSIRQSDRALIESGTASLITNTAEQISAPVLSPQDIENLVAADVQAFQDRLDQCITRTQNEIRTAKRNGRHNITIKKIFNAVCPGIGLSGRNNYCVAGALYAHLLCHDETMNGLLPTKGKFDIRAGNPTTSCPALLQYYKQNLRHCYAQRGDSNFREKCRSIKAGDIIIVSSQRNTSSGMHCVTAAASPTGDKVKVQGFNNERNYEIAFGNIICVINIMDEYTRQRTQFYTQQQQVLLAQTNTGRQDSPAIRSALNSTTALTARETPQEPLPAFLTEQNNALRQNADEPLPAALMRNNRGDR